MDIVIGLKYRDFVFGITNNYFRKYILKPDEYELSILFTSNKIKYAYVHFKNLLVTSYSVTSTRNWDVYINNSCIISKKGDNLRINDNYFLNPFVNRTNEIPTTLNKDTFGWLDEFLEQQLLYKKIVDKNLFKAQIMFLLEEKLDSKENLLQNNFNLLAYNFIRSEKDMSNISKVFSKKTLLKKYPILKEAKIKDIEIQIESFFEDQEPNIFYDKDLILYDIYEHICYKCSLYTKTKENKYKEDENVALCKNILENCIDKKIVIMTEEKETKFLNYENEKEGLNDEEKNEFEFIFKPLYPIMINTLYNKKNKKLRKIIVNSANYLSYMQKIISLFLKYEILTCSDDNEIKYNSLNNIEKLLQELFDISTE